jgi:hypothetical protein
MHVYGPADAMIQRDGLEIIAGISRQSTFSWRERRLAEKQTA